MRLKVERIKELKSQLVIDGFGRKEGNTGVPAITFVKQDVSFTFLHNFVHTSELGLEYLEKHNIEYQIV